LASRDLLPSGPACVRRISCVKNSLYILLNPKNKVRKISGLDSYPRPAESLEWAQQAYMLEVTTCEAKARDKKGAKRIDDLAPGSPDASSNGRVAKEAGLSLRNLSRLSTIKSGCPPKQGTDALRSARGRDRLLTGSKVSEGLSLGPDESLAHFITMV